MYRNAYLSIIFSMMAAILTSCSEEYTEVTFKVICTGAVYPGEFTGYYSVDGGDERSFEDIEQIDSNTYTFTSGTFENFSTLEIYARRLNYDADLIIKVYEDGEKVKSLILNGDSDEDDSDTDYLTLEYEYKAGDDDSSEDEG